MNPCSEIISFLYHSNLFIYCAIWIWLIARKFQLITSLTEYPRVIFAHRTAVLASGGRLGGIAEALQLHEDHLYPQFRYGRSCAPWTLSDNVAEPRGRCGSQSACMLILFPIFIGSWDIDIIILHLCF